MHIHMYALVNLHIIDIITPTVVEIFEKIKVYEVMNTTCLVLY